MTHIYRIIGQEQFLTNNFIKNQEKKMFFMIYRQMTNPNKQDILGVSIEKLNFSNELEDSKIVC